MDSFFPAINFFDRLVFETLLSWVSCFILTFCSTLNWKLKTFAKRKRLTLNFIKISHFSIILEALSKERKMCFYEKIYCRIQYLSFIKNHIVFHFPKHYWRVNNEVRGEADLFSSLNGSNALVSNSITAP